MLGTLFFYTLDEFCERYHVSKDYVLSQFSTVINTELSVSYSVVVSEIDLLNLLGLGNFEGLSDDDPRKEVKILIM